MYSTYINKNFGDHPKREFAVKVAQCIEYIAGNLEDILPKTKPGKDIVLRHPDNNMAFHLDARDAVTDKAAQASIRQQLEGIVAQFKQCFKDFLAIEDEQQRTLIIDCFLNNIIDAPAGCMEARLSMAFEFYSLYQSSDGNFDIDNLLATFLQKLKNKGVPTVAETIDFFANLVEYKMPVVIEGKTQSLTWPILKNYIKKIFEMDDIEQEWLIYGEKLIAGHQDEAPSIVSVKRWRLWSFTTEAKALACLRYVKSILSEYYPELAKATVNYQELNECYCFKLTTEQHDGFFIRIKSHEDPTVVQRRHEIRDRQNLQPPKGDFVIKALRGDSFNFSRSFIRGVFPPNERVTLRVGRKKLFTVTGEGVFGRSGLHIFSTAKKSPQYDLSQKQGFSQIQSTSLSWKDYLTPVFNFGGQLDIAGMMFDIDNVLLSNRLYIYDGGTVGRPYDFDSQEEAEEYYQKNKGSKLFSVSEYEAYKEAIKHHANKFPGSYNEAMVRLRATGEQCPIVFVGKDNLLSRLLAKEYARQMKAFMLGNDLCGEGFDVPIIYYIPDNENLNFKPYTKEEQALDAGVAQWLMSKATDPKVLVQGERRAILLEMPADKVLEEFAKIDDESALFSLLMERGEVHILLSLVEKLSSEEKKRLDNIIANNPKPFLSLLDKLIEGRYTNHPFFNELLQYSIKEQCFSETVREKLLLICIQYGMWGGLTKLLNKIIDRLDASQTDAFGLGVLDYAKQYHRGNDIAGCIVAKQKREHEIYNKLFFSTKTIFNSVSNALTSREHYSATDVAALTLSDRLIAMKKRSVYKWSLLHHIVFDDDLMIARALLTEFSQAQRITALKLRCQYHPSGKIDRNAGATPIHLAVQRKNLKMLILLIGDLEPEHLAPIIQMQKLYGRETALHLAVSKGMLALTTRLLCGFSPSQRKAVLSPKDWRGWTVLHCAVYYNDIAMLKCLCESLSSNDKLALLTAMTNEGETVLHFAARFGSAEVILFLLHKLPLEDIRRLLAQKSESGETALQEVPFWRLENEGVLAYYCNAPWQDHYAESLTRIAVTQRDEAMAKYVITGLGIWFTTNISSINGLTEADKNWMKSIRTQYFPELISSLLLDKLTLTSAQLKLCQAMRSQVVRALKSCHWNNMDALVRAVTPGTQAHTVLFVKRKILGFSFTDTSSPLYKEIRDRILIIRSQSAQTPDSLAQPSVAAFDPPSPTG